MALLYERREHSPNGEYTYEVTIMEVTYGRGYVYSIQYHIGWESEVKSVEGGYRYRIDPNKEQEEISAKTLGCCRFVYNTYLAKRIELYEHNKETFTYVQCANHMKKLK